MDLIWRRGNRTAGFEIKSSREWKSSHNKGLTVLLHAGEIEQAFGIYQGENIQKHGEVTVLPWSTAIQMAADGEFHAGTGTFK